MAGEALSAATLVELGAQLASSSWLSRDVALLFVPCCECALSSAEASALGLWGRGGANPNANAARLCASLSLSLTLTRRRAVARVRPHHCDACCAG